MALPTGWVKRPDGKSYSTNTFTVNNVQYELVVNSETGASDLYQKNTTGNQLFASTNSGNNWALTDKNRFLQTLPQGTTDPAKAEEYFSTNFTLSLNQNRANLITGISTNTSSFTNTPGVNNVAMSGTGTKPVAQAPQSSSALSAIGDTILNPLAAAGDISGSFKGTKTFGILKYPNDLLEKTQDTLIINQFRYKAPQNDIFKSGGDFNKIIKDGLTRGIDFQEESLGHVILPMPNRVSDSNNVGWGGDSMNALNAAVASEISGNFPGYLAAFGGGNLASQVPGLSNVVPQNAGSTAVSAMVIAKLLSNFNNQNIKTSAGAGLVSTIAGAAGYEVPAESILARGFGIVPNSNLELLFSGPQLRQFGFSYRLSPRSSSEAKKIRNIVRFFKEGMAARKSSSGQNFFLGTPNVFKLKYTYNGTDEIKGVNKIKTCALTGFSVDYSPDGQWASFEEGQPASITINMAFAELEPIYSTDYSSDNGVSDDSVGF